MAAPAARRARRRRPFPGARAVALALALLAAGCAPDPREVPVLWVGIDGAGFDLTSEMMDRGELPHLAALRERGAYGPLESIEPMLSPALWTTMATGVERERHGIEGFLALGSTFESEKQYLHTSHMLRVPRIWDIVGEAGRTVGVINYWVTWPVTPVNGFMVSNLWPMSENMRREYAERNRALPEDVPLAEAYYSSTWPLELIDEIEPFIVENEDIPDAELQRLGLSRESYRYIWDLPELRSRTAAGLHLYATRRPDLCIVYYWFLDHVEHQYFGHDLEPVRRSFRELDSILGQYLAIAGDDALVLVTSDHGFQRVRRGRTWYGEHAPLGIVLLAGPQVRAGAALEGASIRDVTPTLLAAMGLPVGDDMDGRVLASALRPEFLERSPIRTVPSHAGGELPRPVEATENPFEDELKDRLRALGYIE